MLSVAYRCWATGLVLYLATTAAAAPLILTAPREVTVLAGTPAIVEITVTNTSDQPLRLDPPDGQGNLQVGFAVEPAALWREIHGPMIVAFDVDCSAVLEPGASIEHEVWLDRAYPCALPAGEYTVRVHYRPGDAPAEWNLSPAVRDLELLSEPIRLRVTEPATPTEQAAYDIFRQAAGGHWAGYRAVGGLIDWRFVYAGVQDSTVRWPELARFVVQSPTVAAIELRRRLPAEALAVFEQALAGGGPDMMARQECLKQLNVALSGDPLRPPAPDDSLTVAGLRADQPVDPRLVNRAILEQAAPEAVQPSLARLWYEYRDTPWGQLTPVLIAQGYNGESGTFSPEQVEAWLSRVDLDRFPLPDLIRRLRGRLHLGAGRLDLYGEEMRQLRDGRWEALSWLKTYQENAAREG